ncbi:MAG: hypothetical protein M0Z80_11785 [Treponema sp.]|nr:hypothetical protein [Treponema sp.]
MKKLVVLLLALMMVGGVVFAQNAAPTVKWNFSMGQGFGVLSDSNTSTYAASAWDWSTEDSSRYRLSFSFTGPDGNSGFFGRLQWKNADTATGLSTNGKLPTFNQAYVWGTFGGSLLKVKAGVLDDYSFATDGWESWGNSDGQLGANFAFTPMSGLNVGFFLPFGGTKMQTAGSAANALSGTLIGVSYSGQQLFAAGGFTLTDPAYNNSSTLGYVYGGVDVKAVQNLTLQVEAKFNPEYVTTSANSLTQIAEFVKYPVGALTPQMYMGQSLYGDSNYKAEFIFEPAVFYQVSSAAKVGLVADIYSYGATNLLTFISPVDGGLNTPAQVAGTAPVMAYGAGPNVSFTSGGFTMTVGDFYAVLPSYAANASTNQNLVYSSFSYNY